MQQESKSLPASLPRCWELLLPQPGSLGRARDLPAYTAPNPAAEMCMANILCSDKITITLRITQDLVVLSFLTTAYLNMFREKTFTFLLSFAKEESFHKERSKIPLENGMTQDFCCHSKGKKPPNFRSS